MRPSRSVIADTGRSNGSVMLENFRHDPAPSSEAASYISSGMFWRPEYRTTRLNGTPSQMFAIVTDSRAVSGEVSQLIRSPPKARSTELTIPLSLLSIHAHVDADTISGSSHGTRNSAR